LFNYEFLYLRVFAGGTEEALQYAPVFKGALGWQLYNYPDYEVTAAVSSDEWVHLKVEVYENNLRVYVGDQVKPNLSVKLLGEYEEAGQLFLKTSFADAYYANVQIKETTPFQVEEPKKSTSNYLTDWLISSQLTGQIVRQAQYFDWINKAEEKKEWKAVKADKNGLVNLARYFNHPEESVFAKAMISSETAKEVVMLYDFSQVMMVALNDQIIAYGYELDTENFGRIMPGEQRIKLPLRAGENKLVLWVRSDDLWQQANPLYLGRAQAMNWGFMVELIDK
ncbi:MAG: hypothetical protein AAGA31_19445, partial [Bacteroidota bacterium]